MFVFLDWILVCMKFIDMNNLVLLYVNFNICRYLVDVVVKGNKKRNTKPINNGAVPLAVDWFSYFV